MNERITQIYNNTKNKENTIQKTNKQIQIELKVKTCPRFKIRSRILYMYVHI